MGSGQWRMRYDADGRHRALGGTAMISTLARVISAVTASAFAFPVIAHHSFVAVFDRDRPIEVTGTVTEVEWLNPHVWFYIDVEDDAGEVVNWGFEMGSPNRLIRTGWNHNSLQIGQTITVVGARARDNSFKAAVQTVTLSTGRELFGAQEESG